MKRLTDAKIKTLTKPGKYGAGVSTLFLLVSKGGSKSWLQRLTVNGVRRDMGLGGWPETSIEEAQRQALENRAQVKAQRRASLLNVVPESTPKMVRQVPLFREAAMEALDAIAPTWKETIRDKTRKHWLFDFERRIFPVLGDMRMNAIEKSDVLKVLLPVWGSKPQMAKKTRQRIRQVFKFSVSCDYCERNLAGEVLDGALPRVKQVKKHHSALEYPKIGSALATVEATGASKAVKLAFRLLVLTAVRSNEVRGATWSEFDLDAALWTIPAERMKARGEHRIPLAPEAVVVLKQARELGGADLVFPSPRDTGKPLSDMAMTKILRDVGLENDKGEKVTVHGFRSSFRDWCADSGKSRELAEQALAHTVKGVEAAYFRSDLLDRRRGLMEAWSAYVSGTQGMVVPIKSGVA